MAALTVSEHIRLPTSPQKDGQLLQKLRVPWEAPESQKLLPLRSQGGFNRGTLCDEQLL